MSERHCWFSFEDGHHTCMLPKGHDGPHEPTPDGDILISLVDGAVAVAVGEDNACVATEPSEFYTAMGIGDDDG